MVVKLTLKRLYTLTIVLSPLLMPYKSVISFMDMGTFLIIIVATMNILALHNRLNISLPQIWIAYIIYMLISMVISLMLSSQLVEASARMVRLCKNILFIYIFLISYKNNIFDFQYGMKIYKIAVIITSIYIYLQTFAAKVLNFLLWGYIPGLVWKTSYVKDILLTSPQSFRPSSLFYEPSHYFIFVFLALIFCMFERKKCGLRNLFLSIFISGGIVLSTSSMGILFVASIWCVWILWQLLNNRTENRTELIFIIICFSLLILTVIIIKTPWISNAIIRVFDKRYVGGNAIAGRGMGYYEITQMPLLNLILGYGYGNVGANYYPSLVYNFLSMGLIGLVLTFHIFFYTYHKCTKKVIKFAFIIYVLLCFYGEIFMSLYLLFFMSFFMNQITNKTHEESSKG